MAPLYLNSSHPVQPVCSRISSSKRSFPSPFSAEKGVGKDELLGVLVNACGG